MSGLSMIEMKAMDDHQIGKRIYDSLSKTDQLRLEIEFNPLGLEQTILKLGELYREAAEDLAMDDDDVKFEDFQIFAEYFLDDEDE
ncbi:hypothetical protein [Rossellomorea yichunensis]|uniref:hypothetical protein n=1 Tax=Rossellomorea yichunensis TaxID=3077331 RepID=UPI0028DE616A|nr:hypothetical protein [Rossellomorea sp. YC4-1]MDT9025095.1 hypothetical protein [Rossellomorea sp. YC4-1]